MELSREKKGEGNLSTLSNVISLAVSVRHGPFDNPRYAIAILVSVRMSRGFTAVWICNISLFCGEVTRCTLQCARMCMYMCIYIYVYIICMHIYIVFLNKPDLSSPVAWLPYAYLPSMPRLLMVKCKARNARSFRPRTDDNTIIYLAPFEILILNHAFPASLPLALSRLGQLQMHLEEILYLHRAFSAECGCLILDFICLMGKSPSISYKH